MNIFLCFLFIIIIIIFLKVFVEILRSDLNSSTNTASSSHILDTSTTTMSYNELIRHFIITETHYKDDLELLIKFFRNPVRTAFTDDQMVREKWNFYFKKIFINQSFQIIESIFGCLDDIYELTNRFLSDLEDAKEMRDDITKNISLYEPLQNFIEVSYTIVYSSRAPSILKSTLTSNCLKLLHKTCIR